MKKTMKAIFAAMLAAVMAFGSLTAFAAEEKKTLKWIYYDWEYYYDYAGEIVLGENVISSPEDSEYCYFVFNAEKAGFYGFGYDADDGWLILPEYCENGVAYNDAGCYFDNDKTEYLYYLGEGENIIAFDSCSNLEDEAFTVEYYGEKVNSVTTSYDLILNYDIYISENEAWIYADGMDCVFDSGKTFRIEYVEGFTECDGSESVVTLTADVLGCKVDLSVNVYRISDIIENVEVTNIEDYLYVTEYYNEYDVFYPYGETMTITYKNGEKQSVVYEEEYCVFKLPDGNEVYFNFFLNVEGDDAKMCLVIAEEEIKYFDCEMEKASVNENFAAVKNDWSMAMNDASFYFRRALIKVLECSNIYEFINYGAPAAGVYFSESFACAASVFTMFFNFIRFYLG